MNTGARLTRWLHYLVRLPAFLFVVVVGSALLPARAYIPEMNWQHVYPYPTGNWLSAVTWGASGYVAAGMEGEILVSGDGAQWERLAIEGVGNSWIRAVCYYNGRYVGVGWDNLIVTSTNARDWAIVSAKTNMILRACAGGAGKYVVAGDQTLLISTNGIHWQKGVAPTSFSDIVFGNGVWAGLNQSSTVYVSSDLTNWTSVNTGFLGLPALTSISFGAGRFVVGGAVELDFNGISTPTVIKTSTNGLDWDSVSLSDLEAWGQTRDLAFAAGSFVAVQNGFFLRSANGSAWEKIIAPDAGGELQAIAASTNGQLVTVGYSGAILTSSNGENWEVVSTQPRIGINAIASDNGLMVAAGGSPAYIGGPMGSAAVLSSTNGYDWQIALTNLTDQLSAIAHGNGLWVVTGDDGGIYTSSNGVNWTNHSLPPTIYDLNKVVYGNGYFIAFPVYHDFVYVSTNGMDWVSNSAPLADEIARVKFLNGRFMGAGGDNDNGFVFSSTDGIAWQKTTLPGIGWLAGLAYGKARYVAAGRDSCALFLDGNNWTTYPTPIGIDDLDYVEGWFIGIGPEGISFSRDGATWQAKPQPIQNENYLSMLSYHAGTMLISGGFNLYRGTLQDTEEFRQRLRQIFPAQLEFYGKSGFEYRLEQTTNFSDWTPFSGWITGTNQYLLWEAGSFQNAANFWRAAGRPKP
jgi:hypothetical protein